MSVEQRPPAPTLLADGALLFITAVWGATFVTVKDALAAADTLTFLSLRFSLGAVVAALLARGALRDRNAWKGGAVLGLLLFAGYVTQTFGLEHTTPSRSAFITGLSVVFVPFASLALFKKAPPLASALGALIAVVGLARLTGFSLGGAVPLGDLLTLACAIIWGFHIALTGKYAEKTSPTALVTVQLLVTAALSTLCIPLGPARLEPTPAFWGAVALTGIVASAVAISIQAWAQKRTTAVRAALFFALEPVFAVAYSSALGREQLHAGELLGGALIIGGVLVSELGAVLLRRLRPRT